MIGPKFEAMARMNDNENLVYAVVNTDDVQEVPQHYKVQAYPTFIAFVNGNKFN
jgi:thioredoxin-like negative regulator of GroEL